MTNRFEKSSAQNIKYTLSGDYYLLSVHHNDQLSFYLGHDEFICLKYLFTKPADALDIEDILVECDKEVAGIDPCDMFSKNIDSLPNSYDVLKKYEDLLNQVFVENISALEFAHSAFDARFTELLKEKVITSDGVTLDITYGILLGMIINSISAADTEMLLEDLGCQVVCVNPTPSCSIPTRFEVNVIPKDFHVVYVVYYDDLSDPEYLYGGTEYEPIYEDEILSSERLQHIDFIENLYFDEKEDAEFFIEDERHASSKKKAAKERSYEFVYKEFPVDL